jgi:hypothetical protein
MATTGTPERETLGARGLLRLSPAELDALFASGSPSAPPGRVDGTIVLAPGTPLAEPLARSLGRVWYGKVFDHATGELRNRVGRDGERLAARARFAVGPSRTDGRPAVILDYSQSDARWLAPVRDELREITPGLYLGVTYVRRRQVGRFALHPPR